MPLSETKLSAVSEKWRDSFEVEWLEVTADTPDLKNVDVELSSIYSINILIKTDSNVKFVALVCVTHLTQVMNMQLESAETLGN